MTGLHDSDIKLNDDWQLTQATDGDAPLTSDLDCLFQAIILEALTQESDLFYDSAFGWSLFDFIQSEDDPMTELEIAQRARQKLLRWEVVVPDSIATSVSFDHDTFHLVVSFQFTESTATYGFTIAITPVNVEVIEID